MHPCPHPCPPVPQVANDLKTVDTFQNAVPNHEYRRGRRVVRPAANIYAPTTAVVVIVGCASATAIGSGGISAVGDWASGVGSAPSISVAMGICVTERVHTDAGACSFSAISVVAVTGVSASIAVGAVASVNAVNGVGAGVCSVAGATTSIVSNTAAVVGAGVSAATGVGAITGVCVAMAVNVIAGVDAVTGIAANVCFVAGAAAASVSTTTIAAAAGFGAPTSVSAAICAGASAGGAPV